MPCREAGKEVKNLFLPTRDRHGAIVANKRRTARGTCTGTSKVIFRLKFPASMPIPKMGVLP